MLAASKPTLQAALGKDLVPLACLTDNDVKALLGAEDMLFEELRRKVPQNDAHQVCGASTDQESLISKRPASV